MNIAQKIIETHKLKALILEDLKYNGKSGMKEIQQRLSEVLPQDIQKTVYKMAKDGEVLTEGVPKQRTYFVNSKKSKWKVKMKTKTVKSLFISNIFYFRVLFKKINEK